MALNSLANRLLDLDNMIEQQRQPNGTYAFVEQAYAMSVERKDSNMCAAPNKEQRKICYIARDAYFKCLDEQNGNIYNCRETLEKMEEKCPMAWIKHFEKTRERQAFTQQMEQKGRGLKS